ncbi:NrfD/PsrC family molybdoenzyme membrane anchor subunit [Thermodesulfatator autotrophicus]|uniref:Polysulfide reductase n=1 Tax=Thermodesulfatator autotrophicus TaxID=1795632 RepID=A0A177E518_9BACT|nr:NrfD/PsrC family molybdoenzyme membrane anchor subunit [Thermodesulfatator autotrophicus]OAG27063.1 polysulfide reductase [Thermodesulfatator autotrophicus]
MAEAREAAIGRELVIIPSKTNVWLAFLFGLLFAVGTAVGIYSFIAGHEHVYGITREVPWGILISTYVFFVVTSTGLCLTSSIGHVFGVQSLMPIASRSVFLAIATIIAGFAVIAFELENPWRMAIYNIISPNPTSNIWWMGTLYGAYLFFMLVEFALLKLGHHRKAGLAGLMGVIAGVAAHSNLGAVFGLVGAKEFWHGPYMPIYFIASAMMSGGAAIIFFTWLAYKVNGWQMDQKMEKALQVTGKIYALLLAIVMFFTTWKILAGLAGHPPGKYEATMALIAGPFAFNFWFFEVGLGLVLPFIVILAVKARNIPAMAIVSGLALLAIFVMRYDLVVLGQLIPHYHGFQIVDMPHLYSYSPTFLEWLVVLGGFGLCGMLFFMGERLFKGHLDEH